MSNNVPDKKQLTWIDNIKVLATLAVIGIHVSAYGVGLEINGGHVTSWWWICNFYESLFRCAVPLFVMVTGTLLLPQQISTGNFLKKRLNRIVLPFIFWSLVYIAYNFMLKYHAEHGAALHNLWPWFWQQIAHGAQYHLWYVYMLIGLYLFIPILQPWIRTANNKTILYFLTIWVIALLLGQLNILNNSALDIRYFTGYIGYLVLGYYIADRVVLTERADSLAVLFFAAGFAVTFTGTYLATEANGTFNDSFYNFLSVNVVLLSTAVFILMKRHCSAPSDSVGSKVRNVISKYGYGIYLSHPFLLNFLVHFGLNYKRFTPIAGIPLTSMVCLVLSGALVYLINRMPFGKHISG